MNVSRACITIPAGYVCGVRMATARYCIGRAIWGAGFGGRESQFPTFLSALALPQRGERRVMDAPIGVSVTFLSPCAHAHRNI